MSFFSWVDEFIVIFQFISTHDKRDVKFRITIKNIYIFFKSTVRVPPPRAARFLADTVAMRAVIDQLFQQEMRGHLSEGLFKQPVIWLLSCSRTACHVRRPRRPARSGRRESTLPSRGRTSPRRCYPPAPHSRHYWLCMLAVYIWRSSEETGCLESRFNHVFSVWSHVYLLFSYMIWWLTPPTHTQTHSCVSTFDVVNLLRVSGSVPHRFPNHIPIVHLIRFAKIWFHAIICSWGLLRLKWI